MQVQRSFKPEIAEKLETIPMEELEAFFSNKWNKDQTLKEDMFPDSFETILNIKPSKRSRPVVEVLREIRTNE